MCSTFTASGPCVPEKMEGKTFTTGTASHTYWLVVDAALANKTYPFGVYTAGKPAAKAATEAAVEPKAATPADKPEATAQAAAEPQAAKPAYSHDGEYEYEPSGDEMDTVLGEVGAGRWLPVGCKERVICGRIVACQQLHQSHLDVRKSATA